MYFESQGLGSSLKRLLAVVFSSAQVELSFARNKNNAAFKPSVKRLFILAGLACFLPLHCVYQHFGFFLDSFFFPRALETQAIRPIFVVSNARSGSTLLQRLLFHNGGDLVSSISVWEMLFAQSVTYRWLVAKTASIDRFVFRGLLHRLLCRIDRSIAEYTARNSPHPFSLLGADEDEWVLSAFGCCQLLGLLFPLLQPSSPLMRLVDFDHALSPQEQRAIFRSYKEIVQRHLYFDRAYRGKPSTVRYLSKNPTFTLRLNSLLNAFPDASIVCVVRDPYQAIPSMVSYITGIWSLIANPQVKYPFRNELQGMCGAHYVYPKLLEISARTGHPDAAFTFIRYEDITTQPNQAARRLLNQLDINWKSTCTEDSAEILQFSYKHDHSVQETLDLSNEAFEKLHRRVFEAYPEYTLVEPVINLRFTIRLSCLQVINKNLRGTIVDVPGEPITMSSLFLKIQEVIEPNVNLSLARASVWV